jgi:hypothetical protein
MRVVENETKLWKALFGQSLPAAVKRFLVKDLAALRVKG